MNRTDRLVAMVMQLQGRRLVRAEELAEHFEVSVRTVYRDIVALGEAGVPVVGEAGVGYTLVKGYHLPPVMFTAEEATALAVAEDLVRELTDRSMAGPMGTALAKIRSVLPADRQDEIERARRATAIDAGRLRRRDVGGTEKFLLPAQAAAAARRVVRVHYRDRSDVVTRRDVEPLGVAYFGGAWYLVGWCRLRADYRHFRIDRIRELEALAERNADRGNYTLQEHLKRSMASEPKIVVQLRVERGAADRIRQDGWHELIAEEPAGPEQVDLTLRTGSLECTARGLMMMAGAAEVLAPVELRERVLELAHAVLEKYHALTFS